MGFKGLLFFFTVFDLLGVTMGYEGIARLKRCHAPPFFHSDGLFLILGVVPFPPNWMVLAWDSLPGKLLVWSCCLAIPLACGFLGVTKQRRTLGLTVMLAWTAASGVLGMWFFFDGLFNGVEP